MLFLFTYKETLNEGISCIFNTTTTYWIVVDHNALSINSASTGTWIYAFLV